MKSEFFNYLKHFMKCISLGRHVDLGKVLNNGFKLQYNAIVIINSQWTTRFAEVTASPIIFFARQVYVPESSG
jgi:hypothetical protein